VKKKAIFLLHGIPPVGWFPCNCGIRFEKEKNVELIRMQEIQKDTSITSRLPLLRRGQRGGLHKL
jgi:hypothetical protein